MLFRFFKLPVKYFVIRFTDLKSPFPADFVSQTSIIINSFFPHAYYFALPEISNGIGTQARDRFASIVSVEVSNTNP